MTDHSQMKLGKLPRRHDRRTLKLARYLATTLPPSPHAVDYTCGVKDWGMMLNDQLGCCTIAAAAHGVQAWTMNSGQEITLPDSAILDAYEKWDGYNPADPATDQGGVELDVLNHWRQQEFNGHSLDAYVSIDLRDSGEVANRVIGRSGDRVNSGKNGSAYQAISGEQSDHATSGSGTQVNTRKQITGSPDQQITRSSDHPITGSPDHPIPQVATAIWLFGGAYIGVELPLSAQSQDVWDVSKNLGPDDEPGSWGGHAVYLVAYDFQNSGLGIRGSGLGTEDPESLVPGPEPLTPNPESRTLTCITWGQPKKMTWAWFEKYCSEAYALVSKDWIEASGVSPSGFDLAALENDLKLVTT